MMNISQLFRNGGISVRSFNVCKNNNFNCISDLKEYFYKNKSFIKLQNCGRRSNEELIDICDKYQDNNKESSISESSKVIKLEKAISELTRDQRYLINSFIYENTNNLTIRSKNGIIRFLDGNLKIKNFATRILLSDSFNVRDIKNIGAKSIQEINFYLNSVREFVFKIYSITEEKELIRLKNKFLIEKKLEGTEVPDHILEAEKLFKIVDYFIAQNVLFDNTQTLIIQNALKLYQNQKIKTLDELSKLLGLTRERVRQVRIFCLNKLSEKLIFVSNINDDLFQKYGIDISNNYLEINNQLASNINALNDTSFSNDFIIYILSVYLKDDFVLVGDYENVLIASESNAQDKHNWNNLYLVKKEIAYEMNFTSFVNDISNRLNDKIEETYSFNLKSYLFKFLTTDKIENLNLLLPICEEILNKEFEVYLDLNESLNFKRNTYKYTHEFAYEALEHLRKPSKVKEIFEKVMELHPNYYTEEAKIRVSMKRKYGFIPIGRKSVFGLKKWESELENFKGGTIRNIVEEYLMQFSVPKHISEITEYVLKYRPKSNQYSILQNLKLDQSGLYTFFKGSHIGLTTKKYESDFKKISEIKKSDKKTWEERLQMLQNFASIKKRLPFSKGVTEKEIKLYRWLNVQKSKQNKGKLAKNKEDKLNSLLAKYPNINGRRRLNSNEKYQELITFVTNNHRLPSANKNGEENLYQFFYKQRKLLDKNELDSKEQNNFIEIAKLLQNIKYENKRN